MHVNIQETTNNISVSLFFDTGTNVQHSTNSKQKGNWITFITAIRAQISNWVHLSAAVVAWFANIEYAWPQQ